MTQTKNSNGVIHSFAVISEAFRHIDLDEDNVIRFLDNRFFIQIFENIPDFRQKEKIKYKLSNILMMVFLTVLERGKTSYVIIADVIEAKKRFYESVGLIEDGQCPSHDTIRMYYLSLIRKACITIRSRHSTSSFNVWSATSLHREITSIWHLTEKRYGAAADQLTRRIPNVIRQCSTSTIPAVLL